MYYLICIMEEQMEEHQTEERSLINDMFKDMKHQRRTSNVIIIIQAIIIIGLIASLVWISMRSQKLLKEQSSEYQTKMVELLTETEFVTEYMIDTDNNSLNNGNITVNKN